MHLSLCTHCFAGIYKMVSENLFFAFAYTKANETNIINVSIYILNICIYVYMDPKRILRIFTYGLNAPVICINGPHLQG